MELSKLLFGPVFLFLALLDHQLIAFELPLPHPVDHGQVHLILDNCWSPGPSTRWSW